MVEKLKLRRPGPGFQSAIGNSLILQLPDNAHVNGLGFRQNILCKLRLTLKQNFAQRADVRGGSRFVKGAPFHANYVNKVVAIFVLATY